MGFIKNMITRFKNRGTKPRQRENPFTEDILPQILLFCSQFYKNLLHFRLVCKSWDHIIMNSLHLWNNVTVTIVGKTNIQKQCMNIFSNISFKSITNDDMINVSQFKNLR